MQSIYRFRDARVELFLEAKENGLGSIKLTPLRLQANFRTDPSVLNFINATLTKAFPKYSDVLTGAVPFTPSVAERTYADAQGVSTLKFVSVAEEAEALTVKIAEILARDPKANIGILGRSRTQLKPVMHQLISAGLPLQAEAWGQLLEAQLILDVLSLTLALTHLGDRLSWMALLRSPMLGLDLDELLNIAQKSNERTLWEVLNEATTEKIRAFVNILQPLIFEPHLLLCTRVQRAFEALTTEFKFSTLEENLLTQYWEFLRAYPLMSSREQFLEAVARLKLNYQTPDARITLLTIHQAKGLEFDYVFLPNLNCGVRRDDPPLLRWQEFHYQGQFKLLVGLHKSANGTADPIYEYLKYVDQAENKYEQVRLLYVALTRAKKSLCLSYVMAEAEQPKAGSFLRFLLNPSTNPL
jgi:ATP-dependent helicase/nuclease subunit A